MVRVGRDDGETLIEILAAVAILSIGIVGLLTALATQASTTGTNRSQSHASTTLLAAAEYVKQLPFGAFSSTCAPGPPVDISPSDVPRDPVFQNGVTYSRAVRFDAPAPAIDPPCSEIGVVQVRVVGDGFDLSTSVVKRP